MEIRWRGGEDGVIYLIDAERNGLPTRFGSTNCHCEWQNEDGCWPRDTFRSLMTFIRNHLDELSPAADNSGR